MKCKALEDLDGEKEFWSLQRIVHVWKYLISFSFFFFDDLKVVCTFHSFDSLPRN